jgi:hypothetical protein
VIDFLGRRKLCQDLQDDDRASTLEARRVRGCATLVAEERRWRQVYFDNAPVMAWLNDDPAEFKLNTISVETWDGPPPIRTNRLELAGTDANGKTPVSVSITTDSNGRNWIRITVSWGDVAPRTIQLPASDFPEFDPSSALIALRPSGPHESLSLRISYGWWRGYCGSLDEDDRPRISMTFTRTNVTGRRRAMTNCNLNYSDLPLVVVAPN